MTREMKMEIASLMKRFPHLYPPERYNTPQKKLIMLEELFRRHGHSVGISRAQVKSRVDNKGKLRRRYNYHVIFNMEVVLTRKVRESAVRYIFKLYKKHCNGQIEKD